MFDEDNRENLRICLAMAPRYCNACNDFHLAVAIRRSGENKQKYGIDFDRQQFRDSIANALKIRRDLKAPLTVLIAGAADTAILKSVLDAAVQVGGEAFARCIQLTVVDLCQTPLKICEAFATLHSLHIETKYADIGVFKPAINFGLVVMHGVLPFFPFDQRLNYMTRIVSWLDSKGLIVSSSQIAETHQLEHVEQEIARHKAMLESFLAGQTEEIIVNRDEMFARLRRAVSMRESYPRVFDHEEALLEFYVKAGLRILNCYTTTSKSTCGSNRYNRRAVVLCELSQ